MESPNARGKVLRKCVVPLTLTNEGSHVQPHLGKQHTQVGSVGQI